MALTLGIMGGTAVRLRNPSQSNPWNHLHVIWGKRGVDEGGVRTVRGSEVGEYSGVWWNEDSGVGWGEYSGVWWGEYSGVWWGEYSGVW